MTPKKRMNFLPTATTWSVTGLKARQKTSSLCPLLGLGLGLGLGLAVRVSG